MNNESVLCVFGQACVTEVLGSTMYILYITYSVHVGRAAHAYSAKPVRQKHKEAQCIILYIIY